MLVKLGYGISLFAYVYALLNTFVTCRRNIVLNNVNMYNTETAKYSTNISYIISQNILQNHLKISSQMYWSLFMQHNKTSCEWYGRFQTFLTTFFHAVVMVTTLLFGKQAPFLWPIPMAVIDIEQIYFHLYGQSIVIFH